MRNARAVALGTCLLVSMAAGSCADNSQCANANLLVPDGSTQTGDLPSGTRWFRVVAKAGRSYAVMLENLTSPDQQGEVGVTSVSSDCSGTLVAFNDTADFFEPVSYDSNAGVGAARVAFKSTANQTLFFPVIQLNTSNGAQFRIRVEETTLVSPLWSTAAGAETVYRLYNTTTNNGSCSVTLDLRRDDNSPGLGGSSAVTFSLGSNRSVTRQTGASDMNLAPGQTGHATVSHDCPPGAVQVEAYVSAAGGTRLLPLTV